MSTDAAVALLDVHADANYLGPILPGDRFVTLTTDLN